MKDLLSDAALWNAVCNNDQLAFESLIKRYWSKVYKLAFDHLKDYEASVDVVHDVFLNIWSRREILEIHSFPSFLLTAVRYQIYTRKKSAKLSLIYNENYAILESRYATNAGIENLERIEFEIELGEYLDKLPKRCHKIFAMSRNEQLTNQEIADRLGISKRSVENQLSIAVRYLKICLKGIANLVCFIYLLS